MYEQVGRYYALFGPTAATTVAEERFLAHWTQSRSQALDFGAGLCGPALLLGRLGLEVVAFEPSDVVATLALDRLSRDSRLENSITLVEGPTPAFDVPFRADFILMRSVLMLLNDSDRAAALDAVVRHALPGARLVLDVRTAYLPWADHGPIQDERKLGHTTYRRKVSYWRTQECSTLVHWATDVEQFGRVVSTAEEEFIVRADTVDTLRALLGARGFAVEDLYGEYDLEHALRADDAVIVAVARLE